MSINAIGNKQALVSCFISGFGFSGKVVAELDIPPDQQTRPEIRIECDESLKDCCCQVYRNV